MFGLQNFRGSCWVNTCIQAVLRIPEVQEQVFQEMNTTLPIFWTKLFTRFGLQKENMVLEDFFEYVRLDTLPAGRDIGDSHELLMYLCDKLPFWIRCVALRLPIQLCARIVEKRN